MPVEDSTRVGDEERPRESSRGWHKGASLGCSIGQAAHDLVQRGGVGCGVGDCNGCPCF